MNPAERSDYERVIRMVLEGELRADDRGVVLLPLELASASQNGRVYVSAKERGVLRIAFPTWVGKGYNMRGFLYTSQPMAAEDIQQDYYGNQVVEVGPAELVLEKKLSESWYAVARSMD